MSRTTELVARGPAAPPFDVMRAAYAELLVSDLDVSERFYADLLGLVVATRTDDALYLRGWEERLHHSLVLRRGDVIAAERLSFRVRSDADLDPIAADFERRGCTTRRVDARPPGHGAGAARLGPVRLPARVLPRHRAVRDPATARSTSTAARR